MYVKQKEGYATVHLSIRSRNLEIIKKYIPELLC